MDVTAPAFLFGQVMHKRLHPKVHGFSYPHYNLVIPVDGLLTPAQFAPLKIETKGALSFFAKDHGNRTGDDLRDWLQNLLREHAVDFTPTTIRLVTLPRVFGYVFNPVSFWLCYDKDENIRLVLCEVNNTFGETHSYLCHTENLDVITSEMVLTGRKLFHVSPFMQREGHYTFRFAVKPDKIAIFIDHFADDGTKMLVTALTGRLEPITVSTYKKALYRYPLVTFRSIWRIHWHAVKLLFKGIRYVPKPEQERNVSSAANTLKKGES